MSRSLFVLGIPGLVLALSLSSQAGVVRDAVPVIREGEVAPGTGGLVVLSLNAPFTNGAGDVGFTGSVDNGGSADFFVWRGDTVIWRNSDGLPSVLTGAESTMGIGDGGEFIYSPATDGDDSVWTDQGLLLKETDPAPDFGGQFVSFTSRPQMVDDGTAKFVGGVTSVSGGSTEFRALWSASNGTITKVLASGDMVGGFVIDTPSGIDFDYAFSDDGSHHIQVLLMDTGSTADDGFVFLDGVLIARETDPSGDGDNWDNFDIVDVNTSGDFIFTGDTDGATTSDEFLAYNGTIAIREGDSIDGRLLTSTASLRYASINNRGQVIHAWGISGGTEILFAGDGDRLAATSRVILATGDFLDLDRDGIADGQVTDLNGSSIIGPGSELGDENAVYLEVDFIPTGEVDEIEMIVRMAIPAACSAGNVNELAGTPESVLRINGSDGGADRSVSIEPLDTAEVSLAASTAGPATPRYVIWVWLGEGRESTILSQGGDAIGCAVNATPLTPNLIPQPRFCLLSQNLPIRACGDAVRRNSPPLGPWTLATTLANPIVLTLQGLVEDDASAHAQGFSVSNAVTLRVE